MRFDPRLGLLADFVIRFNLDLLPATTAPVMFNFVSWRSCVPQLWTVPDKHKGFSWGTSFF
jgi:hypothetical protein